jgi:hypothetical protein
VIERVANNRPAKHIDSNGYQYLFRVYLFQVCGLSFYLHKFVGPDRDRYMHDHPFNGLALVLSGGYQEAYARNLEFPAIRKHYRDIRFFNWIPARHIHQVHNPQPETWTLFIHGKRFKGWGFFRQSSKFHGIEYFNPYPITTDEDPWWKKDCKTFRELRSEVMGLL